VKSFAQAAAPILKQALPVVATVAGTALGGPLGGMVGTLAGKALSGAIGGGSAPSGLPLPPVRRPGGAQMPQTGAAHAPAAAQLLRVISEPQTMKALMSMLMGSAGPRQVPVGGTQVEVAAFANLMGHLAHEALAEYHQAVAGELSGVPEYLLNERGEFLIEDPMDSAQRAEALLARLDAADRMGAARAESDDESAERAAERMPEAWAADDIDAMYDELDFIELYAEES
jgi:hypothetical protein